MWPSINEWLSALYIIIPTYCTNGAPVLFGGGGPIDAGKCLSDGQRILGDHKTVRGFLGGLGVGVIVGAFESVFVSQTLLLVAVLASLGALCGDLAGAFVKRRLKIKPGGSLPVLDQLDFVVGALLFVLPTMDLSLPTALIVVLVTPPIHILANAGAYWLGLKSTYW